MIDTVSGNDVVTMADGYVSGNDVYVIVPDNDTVSDLEPICDSLNVIVLLLSALLFWQIATWVVEHIKNGVRSVFRHE